MGKLPLALPSLQASQLQEKIAELQALGCCLLGDWQGWGPFNYEVWWLGQVNAVSNAYRPQAQHASSTEEQSQEMQRLQEEAAQVGTLVGWWAEMMGSRAAKGRSTMGFAHCKGEHWICTPRQAIFDFHGEVTSVV